MAIYLLKHHDLYIARDQSVTHIAVVQVHAGAVYMINALPLTHTDLS